MKRRLSGAEECISDLGDKIPSNHNSRQKDKKATHNISEIT